MSAHRSSMILYHPSPQEMPQHIQVSVIGSFLWRNIFGYFLYNAASNLMFILFSFTLWNPNSAIKLSGNDRPSSMLIPRIYKCYTLCACSLSRCHSCSVRCLLTHSSRHVSRGTAFLECLVL